MKTIKIADQPWLGLGRTMRITIDGIRYRLFRAAVTVAVIAVAVAFLMNILSESLIKRSVASDTRDRIRRMRMIYDWSGRLTSPGSIGSVLADLSGTPAGSSLYREIQTMSGLDDGTMQTFKQRADRAVVYLGFFAGLDYAKRRTLVHTAAGIEIFAKLKTTAGMDQFTSEIASMKSVRFPTTFDELDTFLASWDDLRTQAEATVAGRTRAIAQITEALGGQTITERLVDAEGEFGQTIRDAGFEFDAAEAAPIVADQARRVLDVLRLEESMEARPTRQLIAQQANILPADVNVMVMWRFLDGRKFARRYLDKMADSELDTEGLSADRVVSLADARKERVSLVRAERMTVDFGGGFMGMGERLTWLLCVSMLVCGIGICNAMLMTVTERFTEIATLKCLGALDGFIMIMFVLESCFLGLVGGVIGAIVGALIGLGRMLVAFGVNFVSAIPAPDMLGGMVAAVIMGVILAAIAAVLPSFKAARLAPMEAMRIE